jgi:hypothetical protein
MDPSVYSSCANGLAISVNANFGSKLVRFPPRRDTASPVYIALCDLTFVSIRWGDEHECWTSNDYQTELS